MGSLELNFKFDKRKVNMALKKVKKQVKDVKKVLRKVGQDEIKDAQHRIRTTKTDPDGKAWRPWAYSTLKQRNREGTTGGGLLYKSGQMWRSFTSSVANNVLTITNKAKQSGYLQFGTPDMPARQFLGWSESSRKRLQTKVSSWIRKGWK